MRFEQVACTSCHALAVTTGGVLFSWGRGSNGELGHGSTEPGDVPRLVQSLEGVPISSAAAGAYTSLALARSGEMWSWGEGFALGHGGNAASQQLLPKVIEDLPPGASVLRIAAGRHMAACVRADGTALSWGRPIPTSRNACKGGQDLLHKRSACAFSQAWDAPACTGGPVAYSAHETETTTVKNPQAQ